MVVVVEWCMHVCRWWCMMVVGCMVVVVEWYMYVCSGGGGSGGSGGLGPGLYLSTSGFMFSTSFEE